MPTLSRHVPSIARFGKRNQQRAPSLGWLPVATSQEIIERLANSRAPNLREGLGLGQVVSPGYSPSLPRVRNIAADLITPMKRGPDNVAHLLSVLPRNRAWDAEDSRSSELVPLFNTQHLLNSSSIFCRSKTKALRACSDDLSVSTRTNTERLRVTGAHPNNQMRGTDMVLAIIARASGQSKRTTRLCWSASERDSLALTFGGNHVEDRARNSYSDRSRRESFS